MSKPKPDELDKLLIDLGLTQETCTECSHSKNAHWYRLWHPEGYEVRTCNDCLRPKCEIGKRHWMKHISKEAKAKLQALINNQVREARIDELRKVKLFNRNLEEVARYVVKRLEALNQDKGDE